MFFLMYNTGVWPDRCLIRQFCGRLNPTKFYFGFSSHIYNHVAWCLQ